MLHAMIAGYLKRQQEAGMIEEVSVPVLHYGYTVMTETFLGLLGAVLAGFIFGDILTVVLFLLLFIPLRIFSGVYHARDGLTCFFLTSGASVIVCMLVAICVNLGQAVSAVVIWTGIFLHLVLMLLFAPVADTNRLFEGGEEKAFRKIVLWICFGESVLGIICVFVGIWYVAWIVFWCQIVLDLALVTAKLGKCFCRGL